MTWISEAQLTWWQWLCLRVLKAGRVPRHAAFIMDGNRRFARHNGVEKLDGHSRGFSKLAETLKWCRDLGITEVTVYAFSIENFRRPQAEVDDLMDLARKKFKILLDERDKIMREGVCVFFIGDVSLLPVDIQRQMAEISLMTRHNTVARLNVAVAYTAREEMSRAVRDVTEGVCGGQLRSRDVTCRLLERCLYTNHSPHPDLLLRTSGEVRLSDFLLWQTTHTCICFTDVLWPDFTIWHLFAAVLRYQRTYHVIQSARSCELRVRHLEDAGFAVGADVRRGHSEAVADSSQVDELETPETQQARVNAFLVALDGKRWTALEKLVSLLSAPTTDTQSATSS